MARPHPVVRIAAKLPDVLRRRCHEAHVGVLLCPNHVEAVGVEEGDDFCAYALASLKLLDVFPLLCQGFEETLALHLCGARALFLGNGKHLVGHVLDLQHEGKGEVGCGEFLGAAVCEEAVLGIVVLLGAHVVHVTEPAVVVGEYQSLGRYHLARAASAEHADAVAQRGRRFAVKGFGRQHQPGFFKGIHEMLLLHQFQEPHALVGARHNGAQKHRERDKSLFHIAIILFEIAFKVQSWQEKLNYLRRKQQITAKSQKKPQKSEGRAVRRVPRAIYYILCGSD